MHEVRVSAQPMDRFALVIGEARVALAHAAAARLATRLGGHSVWNINSTSRGGGVAELLRSIVGYARSTRVDVRWGVIDGNPDFFRVTKRLHNALHDSEGDGTPLGPEQRGIYESTLEREAQTMTELIRPGDVVLLHDPQTAGLLGPLAKMGANVVWRCHVGNDVLTPEVARGWAFLAPYLHAAKRFVFSRSTYAPPEVDPERLVIIPPTIDPFSTKNQPMDASCAIAILQRTGILGGALLPEDPVYARDDGTRGRVDRRSEVVRYGRAPAPELPLVVQVSRWDRLKDPAGVMRGFVRLSEGAELVLAGPDVRTVTDDPEGTAVYAEVRGQLESLPDSVRRHVHLVSLPMEDAEENGAIVNALQRHARVVVQKSLREGFGLTVTEAMWKARPVVASAVGGIQDQIEDGFSGLLLHDPSDEAAFSGLVFRALVDHELAAKLGMNARNSVREHYLGLSSLLRYAEVVNQALD